MIDKKKYNNFWHQVKKIGADRDSISVDLVYGYTGTKKDKVETYYGAVSLMPKINDRLRNDGAIIEVTIVAKDEEGKVILRQIFDVQREQNAELPTTALPTDLMQHNPMNLNASHSLNGTHRFADIHTLAGIENEVQRQVKEYALGAKLEKAQEEKALLQQQLGQSQALSRKYRKLALKYKKELADNESYLEEELDSDKRLAKTIGMAATLIPVHKLKELRKYENVDGLLGMILGEERKELGQGDSTETDNEADSVLVPEAIISANHPAKRQEYQADMFQRINQLADEPFAKLFGIIHQCLANEQKLINTVFELLREQAKNGN